MATLRSSRAKHQGAGSGSLTSTITLGNPTGLTDGDFMWAIFTMTFGTTGLSVSSVPTGWTLVLASGPIANGSGVYGYFWVYRRVASSEPTSRSWTLNNSVAFYNCQLIAATGVNTTTPYEQLSSTTSASVSTGATISRAADTTASSETLVSILMAGNGSGATTFAESAGTEQFDENFGGCTIAVNFLDIPSAAHQAVTGTATISAGGTAALAMTQMAMFPSAVNATIVAVPASATASCAVPTAGPGIGAVPARATAVALVPPVITGSQTVTVVPGLAIASRVAPHQSSSRIELLLPPDIGGTIELVEDP